MRDDFLEDGAISSYRRHHEEIKELPKPAVPAKKFVRRTGREYPDCMENNNDDPNGVYPRSR